MKLDMQESVAIVTGAGGNLGRAVSAAFLRAGARVVMVHRKVDATFGKSDVDQGRQLAVVADLTDASSAKRAVDQAFSRWGRLDVLCNIAGGFAMGTQAHATPGEVWRRMFELNVMTAVHMAAGVVPRMITAGKGAIVNVGAASSMRGQAQMAAYAVAKNGVVRLTECMSAELHPLGISVTCLLPTVIDTAQNRAAMPDADTSRWTSPDDIASIILWLTSDAAYSCSGDAFNISGGAPMRNENG